MILTNLNKLIGQLDQRFETTSSFNSAINKILYETSQEEIGFNVESQFDEIYSKNNGFSLTWKMDDQILGELFLPRITSIFASSAQERCIYVDHEWGEQFKTFARQFWPLDIYKESLDSVTLTVVKIIDEDHLELWIWNNAGQKYKLKFKSIEDYLEAGVQCKFIVCWQYFYVDTEALDFNDPFTNEWIASSYAGAISRMETAMESMKEYFPEEDWSYQENELERVKQLG